MYKVNSMRCESLCAPALTASCISHIANSTVVCLLATQSLHEWYSGERGLSIRNINKVLFMCWVYPCPAGPAGPRLSKGPGWPKAH